MTTPETIDLEGLQHICEGPLVLTESGTVYVSLPRLRLPCGCEPAVADALLRPGSGPDGYTSRLFLSAPYPLKGQNWTTHHILGRTWHAFSYNGVPADLHLIEILSNHLRVLQ